MDEGDILLARRIPLNPRETGGSLTSRLGALGAEVLVEGLALAKTGGLPVVPQDPAIATYAPLLKKSDGVLDLLRPAEELDRRIRAFSPWPGTSILLTDGSPLKILRAEVGDPGGTQDLEPGCITSLQPLTVQTGHGRLLLVELQPPGKRGMDAGSFLRGSGRALQIGSRLSVVEH